MFVRILIVAVVATIAWATFVRPSESAGPERTYVVQPADTLWSIASEHYAGDPRAAIWKLQQRNGLTSTTLRPGQELVLPRG
ncbi:MAG TPA: LysM peptidoglycan-binding domain-containing protein [Gaiellaceae bacterium]|nr:LysM peptidoglycan-binding domain-containing protein [Gaiellaceae bacterium]